MRFVSLHHHSTFSYLDGYQLPEAHVRRAGELGMEALALTEHGNVSSHVKLEMAAKELGVKPIYGCEIYTGAVDVEERTQRKNHLTVLARTQEGYRNLLRLVSQGWSDFYYEPTVSGATLAKYRRGLTVLSGCTGSLLATSLVGGKNIAPEEASYRRGKNVARRFKKVFGNHYYLEVQAFPELEITRKLNPMIAQISEELGIPLVATGDIHYTLPDEAEMQQILHNVRGGNRQTLEDQARAWGYDVPLCPPNSDRNVYKRLRATGLTRRQAEQAIINTELIAQDCTVELPKMEMVRYPLPEGYDSAEELWRDWLLEGWNYRGVNNLPGPLRAKYRAALKKEMEVIEGKDYIDYFLIVSDLVKFAKDNQIPVGPARGSAAASVACWLLRITEVDPVYFDWLVFERFIDESRQDLPDIDLDFDSDQRWRIRDYAERKYGREQVGNIGTFTFYKSKNSLDDVARVFRLPQWRVDTVKELLIERSSGDLRASDTIEDTVEQFEQAQEVFNEHPELRKAMLLEGNIKGFGVHAAGLIIGERPLQDICAIYEREVNGHRYDVISLDKWDAERQGLIKIDILGLSTMTLISEALILLGMELEELYDIPLDDPQVIDAFRRNDTVGIFQFDGRAMRQVTAELKPDTFKEICDINALARPGPLHNGATAEYIDVKHGRKEAEQIHPILDSITEDTHYQIVYQEQILRIVREVGNFSWTHAAYIRKIISKKLGEQEFQRQFGRFAEGAAEHGLSEEEAQDIWNRCITAGSYAFNAAHSVSYGMLAYWTMWLKVYHPQVFYVAALRTLNPDKHIDLLKDATRHDIEVLPPHPGISERDWTVGEQPGTIRGGLVSVKGIGDTVAKKILDYREGLEDPRGMGWSELLSVHGIGPKKIESFLEFCEQDDPYRIFWLRDRIQQVKDEAADLGLPAITHGSLDIPYSRGRDTEIVWAGIIKSRNLKDLYELHYSRTGQELDPEQTRDPHLREWVVLWGADNEEVLHINVDRWRYPKFKRAVWNIKLDSDVVVIRGVKKGFQSKRSIYVMDLWVVDPDG